MSKGMGRGLLIILEGCDRSGKSTICKRLVKWLCEEQSLHAQAMRFPDRSTRIGGLLDEYLRGTTKVDDHAVHLLFSSNRWERVSDITSALQAGSHVIVDRYAFSGVAFSAAKAGLSMEWCKQPDRGLPKPDLVCFLDVSPEEARVRGGFGNEIYENEDFQALVRKNYEVLIDDTWHSINTNQKTMDQVFNEVSQVVMETIKTHNGEPVGRLWALNGKC